jgi:hypothetical protein
MISGKPVYLLTSVTGIPASTKLFEVEPVEKYFNSCRMKGSTNFDQSILVINANQRPA